MTILMGKIIALCRSVRICVTVQLAAPRGSSARSGMFLGRDIDAQYPKFLTYSNKDKNSCGVFGGSHDAHLERSKFGSFTCGLKKPHSDSFHCLRKVILIYSKPTLMNHQIVYIIPLAPKITHTTRKHNLMGAKRWVKTSIFFLGPARGWPLSPRPRPFPLPRPLPLAPSSTLGGGTTGAADALAWRHKLPLGSAKAFVWSNPFISFWAACKWKGSIKGTIKWANWNRNRFKPSFLRRPCLTVPHIHGWARLCFHT